MPSLDTRERERERKRERERERERGIIGECTLGTLGESEKA